MAILNHKGNVLLFTVVVFALISVLGTGIYFMTTTAIFSGLGSNQQNRAYQLALAGKDYALIKNLPNTSGSNYVLDSNEKFQLDISGNNIDSTGIVNEGTPFEAKRMVSVTVSGFSSRSDISFAKDIASFPQAPSTAQTGFVDVDTTAAKISLGQLQASKFGSVWYSGTSSLGNCENGECDFGSGFRAYFIFKLERSSLDPHGFTFAFFNGADNSSTSSGGDYGMPELLAYGGDSCTARNAFNACTSFLDPVGQGIHPPKIAIEFDGRQNIGSADFCHTSFSGNSNSRGDGARTHMSYVFWGDNTMAAICANRENSKTYDDNRHNAGSLTDPYNSVANDSSDTENYFVGLTPGWASDWLFNTVKVYAVRIEVTRGSTPNSNGNYFYTINTWIKRCNSEDINDGNSCSEFSGLSNTKEAYDPSPADPPVLKQTIELDSTYHTKFNKFLFGWTAAAGSQTMENLTLKNFRLNFNREPVTCGGYGVWNNLGSTRYFKINGIGCTGVLNGSRIANIGPSGIIQGYTDATCATAASPSGITYDQAKTADADADCTVNYSGTDR